MFSKILITASIALLIATAYIVASYGENVYFVAFHKPLHISLFQTSPQKYTSPIMPTFTVTKGVSGHSLTPGAVQNIRLSVLSSQSISGYIKVWISSPANKQVFRSSTVGKPTQFTKGKTQTFNYRYMIPWNVPKGTYNISAIISSANSQTDYYVNTDFASFNVS